MGNKPQSIDWLHSFQILALAASCRGQMMAELKKLDISPDNIEGVEQYTDLSIDEIITQALGGIDRKLAGMISLDMIKL